MMPRRVLVVDDNPVIRTLWCDSLSLLGYEVTPAQDGADALARFDPAAYDLVLTDLLMPGMGGWQLAEAIRSRATTPVVVITGAASDEDHARADLHGMILLQKPLQLVELRRAVEQALQPNRSTV
jgi:CheY-like chemotaxis protein